MSAIDLEVIRRRHNQQPPSSATKSEWDDVDTLLAHVDELRAELEVYKAADYSSLATNADALRYRDERDILASATAKIAISAGIYNGEVPLDGPQLLTLCDDLATAALNRADNRIMKLEDRVNQLSDQKERTGMDDRARKLASTIDWQQVVLNGGAPCFFIEDDRFCLRAERWQGHGHQQFHKFISLASLLSTYGDERERSALERAVETATRHRYWGGFLNNRVVDAIRALIKP